MVFALKMDATMMTRVVPPVTKRTKTTGVQKVQILAPNLNTIKNVLSKIFFLMLKPATK